MQWWSAELTGMLPARVRQSALFSRHRLRLEIDGHDLVCTRSGHRGEELLGRFPVPTAGAGVPPKGLSGLVPAGTEVVLCLPPDQLLSRTLGLPLATQENLREVLGFEMDRHTPFTARQVYYDYRILARDTRKGLLSIQLLYAPRRFVDQTLDSVNRLGLRPQVVTTTEDGRARESALNLLPPELRTRSTNSVQWLNRALMLVALTLTLANLGLPLLDKRQQIQALEPLLEKGLKQAEMAQRLRTEVDALLAESRFLFRRKQEAPQTLGVLNELTGILPDDTWLHRFEIRGREVQIHGQSAAAAELIRLLESSPMLANVRFRSPLTQNLRAGGERFHLSADIKAEGGT